MVKDFNKETIDKRIKENFDKVCEQTNFMPLQFLADLKSQVKELCPDYPWNDETDTAFTYLWAITESYKGVCKACDDWYHMVDTVEFYKTENGDWAAARNNLTGYDKNKFKALANLYEKEGLAPYGRSVDN